MAAVGLMGNYPSVGVSFYELEEATRPIANFRPDSVPILPLEEAGEVASIWPPPPRAAPWRPREAGGAEREADVADPGIEDEMGDIHGGEDDPANAALRLEEPLLVQELDLLDDAALFPQPADSVDG